MRKEMACCDIISTQYELIVRLPVCLICLRTILLDSLVRANHVYLI